MFFNFAFGLLHSKALAFSAAAKRRWVTSLFICASGFCLLRFFSIRKERVKKRTVAVEANSPEHQRQAWCKQEHQLPLQGLKGGRKLVIMEPQGGRARVLDGAELAYQNIATEARVRTHAHRKNHHPLTRGSWWCSLCCRQTRRKGWCWRLCGRPSVWPSRGLWYRRSSRSHHGSSQNWSTQHNKCFMLCLF